MPDAIYQIFRRDVSLCFTASHSGINGFEELAGWHADYYYCYAKFFCPGFFFYTFILCFVFYILVNPPLWPVFAMEIMR
jgi:hypothetical protein